MKKEFLFFALLFAVLFISCSDEDSALKQEFDYTTFDSREILYSELHKLTPSTNKGQSDDEFYNSVSAINDALNTNIEITNFDLFQKEYIYADLDLYLNEGHISIDDYEIIDDFITDLNSNSFELSIKKLENKILNMQFDNAEFKKYNDFINILLIVNNYYSERGVNIFDNNNGINNKGGGAGCAVAIAANAVSTIGLGSCVVPGPNCALAAVGKGLSLLGIYYSC